MRFAVRVIQAISLLTLATSSAVAGAGSAPGGPAEFPESAFIPSPDKTAHVLLIESAVSAVRTALELAGAAHDIYIGNSWATLSLAPYSQIFVAVDGASPTDADVKAISDFAAAGGAVHLLGGSSDAGFATFVNARLIGIDLANYEWGYNAGTPDLQAIDTFSYLARGLTSPYDFAGTSIPFYSLRITDPAAHIVANNSDGVPVLASKKLGQGHLDVFAYVPGNSRYGNAADRTQFNRLVANMLGGPEALPPVLVLGTDRGAITQALTELGVAWEQNDGGDWSLYDLSAYRQVFVGLNGGTYSAACFANLGNYVTAGGTLNCCGGSSDLDLTTRINGYLVGVDLVDYWWKLATTAPQVTNLLPGSRLGYGLPTTFNFASSASTYYSLVVTDPVARIVAANSAGHPSLVTRSRGAGKVNIMTSVTTYLGSVADRAWFRQVVANMLDSGAPIISSIADIPGDQGGNVRLGWKGSWQDAVGSDEPVASYSIWRRLGTSSAASVKGLPGGTWDFVTTVPAQRLGNYQAVVPTLCDATVDAMCRTTFAVSAVTTDGLTFYYSQADSGYSVDNLAPSVPVAFARLDVTTLGWGDPVDADFRYFTVYGSNSGVFDDSATVVGHVTGRTQDVGGLGWDWYYLTATDYAGNESGAATLNGVTAVPGALPTAYALHGATPNPFNPQTELRFDLPSASRVSLTVYDVSGRQVRTLVADEPLGAGSQVRAWNGRDDTGRALPAGAYLYRLQAGAFTQTRTMMLVK